MFRDKVNTPNKKDQFKLFMPTLIMATYIYLILSQILSIQTTDVKLRYMEKQ